MIQIKTIEIAGMASVLQALRLPEWKVFIDWVKSLPFANELILVGLDKQK